MIKNDGGIFIIDKPEKISSAAVVSHVKRIPGVKKAGHTGTLDPFATGVMVVCVNQATRLAQFFLHDSKTYEGVMELGIETDTQDITGSVISRIDIDSISADFSPDSLSSKHIESVFSGFKGKISQVPPVYSALKHNGVPLYKLARKGKPVEKPPRTVTIHSLHIIKIDLPEIKFEVSCSSGTYIRTLASDIGKKLGCGGCLKKLRRTVSSGFDISEAISVEEINDPTKREKIEERLISMPEALPHIPEATADKDIACRIMVGMPIKKQDILFKADVRPSGEIVKVVDGNRHLLAIVKEKKNSPVYDYCCVFPE